MRHCSTSLHRFTSRWHSQLPQFGFNDRSGAGVSGHGDRSLQEVEVESKAEVKTICLFKHPV